MSAQLELITRVLVRMRRDEHGIERRGVHVRARHAGCYERERRVADNLVFTASMRLICFALAGWLAVRLHRKHAYAVAVAFIASAWLWRFVPWRMYRAFDDDTLALVHNFTAIGGLLLGAAWGIYKEKRRALANTASSI